MDQTRKHNIERLMGHLDSNADFRYLRRYLFEEITVGTSKSGGYNGRVIDFPGMGEVTGKSDEAYAVSLLDNRFPGALDADMSDPKIGDLAYWVIAHLFMSAVVDQLVGFYYYPPQGIRDYNTIHAGSYSAAGHAMMTLTKAGHTMRFRVSLDGKPADLNPSPADLDLQLWIYYVDQDGMDLSSFRRPVKVRDLNKAIIGLAKSLDIA